MPVSAGLNAKKRISRQAAENAKSPEKGSARRESSTSLQRHSQLYPGHDHRLCGASLRLCTRSFSDRGQALPTTDLAAPRQGTGTAHPPVAAGASTPDAGTGWCSSRRVCGFIHAMRAMVLRETRPIADRPLSLEDIPRPQPAAGEFLVRVEACGICRTDLHVVEGELPPRRAAVVPGHQVVGRIEALGPGASRYPLGTRVGIAWLRWTCGRCRYCT